MRAQSTKSPPYRHNLSSLPAEVLRRISSHLPASSVFSLQLTNRALNKSCTDWIIFRDIVLNGSNSNLSRGAWKEEWDLEQLKSCMKDGTYESCDWIRWAVADEKAVEFVQAGVPTSLCNTRRKTYWARGNLMDAENLVRWMPDLVVMRHPISLYGHAELRDSVIRHNGSSTKTKTETLLWFCITASVLSSCQDLNTEDDRLQFYKTVFEPHETEYLTVVSCLPPIPRREPPKTSDIHNHILIPAYKAVIIFYIELCSAYTSGRLRKQVYPPHKTLASPPLTRDIPFASFTNLYENSFFPLRSRKSSGSKDIWHLPKMMTPEFLSDGEWIGCIYMCPLGEHRPSFISYLWQGAKFTASQNTSNANILDVRSNRDEFDALGNSHFEGQLWKDSGKMNFARIYEDAGHPTSGMPLLGVLFPFGIMASDLSGKWWIWLWKKEWGREWKG